MTPRYRVLRKLGAGGMAEVVAAHDELTGREVALKRPTISSEDHKRDQVIALFRQEYHVLTQFAHPAVIEVYDFGFDGDTPFYTMELLPQNADLTSRMPLPWQRVCEILVDLCGPLSVLHARRLVHRDLSPRNVCFTSDGRVKLIDFGALGSMGASYPVVGTPAFVPPEVLRNEPLTGRVDIYALGALAYAAISGHHAYPARSFSALEALWRKQLEPLPASLEVPVALQALITAMLSLDATARVPDVTEVIERAGALIGRTDHVAAAQIQAYLSTPTLTGRDTSMNAVKPLLIRAAVGRGASVVVRGAEGSGRSRMLQAIAIEAKLRGHIVVQVGCRPLVGPLAGLREIFLRLRDATPDRLRAACGGAEAALAPLLNDDSEPTSLPGAGAATTHKAALDALVRLTEMQPLTILVDDFDLCDSATARLLVQLGMRANKLRCVLGVAGPNDVKASDGLKARSPFEMLLSSAQLIELEPLKEHEVHALLASLFGDAQHLPRVSKWVLAVSAGLPRACMELAQHLVDSRIVRYADGAFQLPMTLEGLALPETVQQLWSMRFASLSPAAHALLETLSMVQSDGELEIAELLNVVAARFVERDVFFAIEELAAANVLHERAGKYSCEQRSLLDRVAAAMSEAQVQERNEQLGHVYRARGGGFAFRAAYHYWRAGQVDQVVPLLRAGRSSADRSAQGIDDNRLFIVTGSVHEMVIERYESERARGAPKSELYHLRKLILQVGAWVKPELVRYAPDAIAQLRFDLGLDLWDQLDPNTDPNARLVQCLAHAQQRFASLSEAERGLPVAEAIPETATSVLLLTGPYAVTYDVKGITELNALVQPLAGLAPVLRLVADFIQAAYASLVLGATTAAYRRSAMAILEQPIDGVDVMTRDTAARLNKYYLALEIASEGRDEALPYADELEREPAFEALALQVRRIHALNRGRYSAAQKYRARREQLALQSEDADQHLHMSILRELQSAHLGNDYLESSRVALAIRKRTEQYPGWRPWLTFALAYQRVAAGANHEAEPMLRHQLAAIEPFTHGAWEQTALLLSQLLVARREYAEACSILQPIRDRAIELGVELDIGRQMRSCMAVAKGGMGQGAEAARELDALVAAEQKAIPGSLPFALICEARAELAAMQHDQPTIDRMLTLIRPIFCEGKHPGLAARYEQLLARVQPRSSDGALERERDADRINAMLKTGLATRSEGEQGEYLLSVLLAELGAERGCLYRIENQRPVLIAAHNIAITEQFSTHVERLALERSQIDDDSMATAMEDDLDTNWMLLDKNGRPYAHRWLLNQEDPDRSPTIALVDCDLVRMSTLPAAFVQSLARAIHALG